MHMDDLALLTGASPAVGSKRKATNRTEKPKKHAKTSESQEINDSASPDDAKVKKQKRLEKNREAAQLFRQRQKAYIQDLEQKVDSLVSENQQFTNRAELLESENRLLRDQLNYLRNFMTQVMLMSNPNPNQSHNGAPPPQHFLYQQHSNIPSSSSSSGNSNSSSRRQSPGTMDSYSEHSLLSEIPRMNDSSNNPAASVAAAFQAIIFPQRE